MELGGESLHGGQALLSVALLHANMNVVLGLLALHLAVASISKRVCAGRERGSVSVASVERDRAGRERIQKRATRANAARAPRVPTYQIPRVRGQGGLQYRT